MFNLIQNQAIGFYERELTGQFSFKTCKPGKQLITFSILLILGIATQAQKKNAAEQYMDAYKKYLSATCPIEKDSIKHFVYFARDRESIKGHPLLTHQMFPGAQIMYAWRDLEPTKGKYDFSIVNEDYKYLKQFRKKLFIQLQDVSFDPGHHVIPDYLLTAEYNGGATMQYSDEGKAEGWVSKRWNQKLRKRFALLLQALGKEFDGEIEGINLQETSIGVDSKIDTSFSEEAYILGLKENMLALKQSFPKSVTMIYANFTPGEWLPYEDKGYLRSLYKYGEAIGVGLGGPDLMVEKKGQLNHALAMMHERQYTVPLGIAVQDGNYIGETGDTDEAAKKKGHPNIVPLLHAFAKDFLKINYMFWVNEEPYFRKDVLGCFGNDK